MKELSPKEVQHLTDIWNLIRQAAELLEGLRPAGGFSAYIDPAYCPTCKQRKKDHQTQC